MQTTEREARKFVGFSNFVRHNPKSDKFQIESFDHIEFYCGDATNAAARFCWALGMRVISKSDQSTGNHSYASYTIQSQKCTFIMTAPYSTKCITPNTKQPLPYFKNEEAHEFFKKHGLAAKAIGLRVGDAAEAYHCSTSNGAIGVQEPVTLVCELTGKTTVVSEIIAYGEVVIRFISGDVYNGLPNYAPVESPDLNYGIHRVDHTVGNVGSLWDTVEYLQNALGFHEFGEFTAEDVGTVDSGLNSYVLANNNEMVLMPINEPTFGTKRKSQIQTYLEQNEGSGLQHIALKTDNIFATIKEMRQRLYVGGFDFMPRGSPEYYKNLHDKCGDILTAEQYKLIEEWGLLADKDDQGVLIQIFTKPIGDRATIFFEIIQRVGCDKDRDGNPMEQTGGCGGFGKGNFSELFKSLEDYTRQIGVDNL